MQMLNVLFRYANGYTNRSMPTEIGTLLFFLLNMDLDFLVSKN